jgi:excinuclease UvrABC helicase subunit UvrB
MTIWLSHQHVGDEIESLEQIDPLTSKVKQNYLRLPIYPKTHYVMTEESRHNALSSIENELQWWKGELDKQGKRIEGQRLWQRTMFDLEMIRNIGYCHGIENYSRHFSGRLPGQAPPTLLDYLPADSPCSRTKAIKRFLNAGHVSRRPLAQGNPEIRVPPAQRHGQSSVDV